MLDLLFSEYVCDCVDGMCECVNVRVSVHSGNVSRGGGGKCVRFKSQAGQGLFNNNKIYIICDIYLICSFLHDILFEFDSVCVCFMMMIMMCWIVVANICDIDINIINCVFFFWTHFQQKKLVLMCGRHIKSGDCSSDTTRFWFGHNKIRRCLCVRFAHAAVLVVVVVVLHPMLLRLLSWISLM